MTVLNGEKYLKMTNLVTRRLVNAPGSDSDLNNNSIDSIKEASKEMEDEEEMEPLPSRPNAREMGLDKSGEFTLLDDTYVFKHLNQKWKNWITRFIFGSLMIVTFSYIIYLGPWAIVLLVLGIELKCFQELITIGHVVYKSHHLPAFRSLSWYFLLTSNYYLYGESMIEKFNMFLRRDVFLRPFVVYHRFISFSLYTAGFVAFVLTLKKTYYLKQFTLFGYTHLGLVLVVTVSNLMILNVFEGLVWFLLPNALIICNDIMAYMFGFFFGRTRLIQLSPKKTWEGFIGGAVSTVAFAFLLSGYLCQFKSLICPLEYDEKSQSINMDNCEPLGIYKLREYELFYGRFKVSLYPFQFHALALGTFASTIGPFGGFFASGFKRAFKIKDFGNSIPGHGGFMDRFDCKFIMAGFVNVYIHSFIRSLSPLKLYNQLMAFKTDDQMEFLRLVRNQFGDLDLLNNQT